MRCGYRTWCFRFRSGFRLARGPQTGRSHCRWRSKYSVLYSQCKPRYSFFQPPDLTDSFQCVPAKTVQRLHQDQVYVPFGTVSQELLITGALIRTGARCGVGIHFGQYPIGMVMDVACIVADLGCQTVLLFLMPGADTAIGRNPKRPIFCWHLPCRFWNLSCFSVHNKTSMIIAE